MTDLDLRAGQIHRGLGVVARWPDIALVIPSDAAHDATVDKMFHDLGPAPTSPALVGAINALLADNKLHSVAMLVEATGGPLAMAYGPVEVLVDGQQVLDGSNGGVRQQMSTSAHRLTIRATNLSKAAEPVAPYDLRRGIAPGAGLTLVTVAVAIPPAPTNLKPASPAPPPTPTPPTPPAGSDDAPSDPTMDPTLDRPMAARAGTPVEREPAPASEDRSLDPALNFAQSPDRVQSPPGVRSGRFEESSIDDAPPPVPQAERQKPAIDPAPISVPFRSVLLIGSEVDSEIVPLPLADVPKSGELSRGELDAGRVEVQGILCSRQHFNNPGAAYCMVCGISMLHLTHNLVKGPRPTLGFIVFDDGSTFGLDRSYVIGREPVAGDRSDAELLVLHDNNETLSRTHAELQLVDWTVHLLDLESTNGTYIWDQSFERWNQLAPGHPVELSSGDTVALGRRTFVFESVSRN
ncbi:MAG: FHA domain-containing protein [Acidimicrobiales bacterium]